MRMETGERSSQVRTSTTCFFPARAFMSQPTCHTPEFGITHAGGHVAGVNMF